MAMLTNDWAVALAGEFKKPYYKDLYNFVRAEYATRTIYPPADDIFNALHYTPLSEVKVVILGQDPYHNVNQAHGLCFSVLPSQPELPPSLQNIYKELESDLGCKVPNNGYLEKWAKQGVLLLNTVLTVEAHKAGSHRGKGWETFTTATISYLNEVRPHLVFLLWGRDARNKKSLIDASKHLGLGSPHPSPLSAHTGFFGNHHFSRCNEFLEQHDMLPVKW